MLLKELFLKEDDRSTAVFAFGRFNPPTIGHEKLLKSAASEASRLGYDLKIYPSRSVDAKKNPLQPGAKIEYMKKMLYWRHFLFFFNKNKGYNKYERK